MSRKARWDKHAIKAEIHRRGATLRSLETDFGLETNTCAVALDRPFPKAERAIAAFLGLRLHDLWPDRYDDEDMRIRYIGDDLKTARKQPRTAAQRHRLSQVKRRNVMRMREAV